MFEEKIIKKHLNDPNCYNISFGGKGNWLGRVSVRDEKGETLQVSVEDPRYTSGELKHISKGKMNVKDNLGNCFSVDVTDPRVLSGELLPISKNRVSVKNSEGNIEYISTSDPRYISGELKHMSSGTTVVEDENGNRKRIDLADSDFKSGKLKHINKGKITVRDPKNPELGFFQVLKTDIRFLSGDLVSITKDRKYITNGKKNRLIYLEEPLPEGWRYGRTNESNGLKKLKKN